ncbi:hypothetical protein CHH61_03455 [Shouchella clausii]|uniref:Uncharacterized protein n=1 Tax=Shouchella clausii TaxID=79880 RepID=A0A268S4B0_SHOCL|nr:hypothetical protein [Shouchella clausii]PAF27388.1 hypothetical protein CHH61_03455 [Shouchella clausii]
MRTVFEELGGKYENRLMDLGINLFLNKDEALKTLKAFDSDKFGVESLEEYLDALKFPVIAMPILAYDGASESLNISRWSYEDWLFDSNSSTEVIINTAKERI